MNQVYFVRIKRKTLGPFSLSELKELRRRGKLCVSDELSDDGRSWTVAGAFAAVFPQTPASTVDFCDISAIQQGATAFSPAALDADLPNSAGAFFYVDKNGDSQGPLSQENVLRLVQLGELCLSTLVWRDGMSQWQSIQTAIVWASSPTSQATPEVMRRGPRRAHFLDFAGFCPITGQPNPSDSIRLVRFSFLIVMFRVETVVVPVTPMGRYLHSKNKGTFWSLIDKLWWLSYVPIFGASLLLLSFVYGAAAAPIWMMFDLFLGRRIFGRGLVRLVDSDGMLQLEEVVVH